MCWCVNVCESCYRVIWHNHFIWKEYSVHNLQPAGKKTLDLFCCSIQCGKSIEIVLFSNCIPPNEHTSMGELDEGSCEAWVRVWKNQRQVSGLIWPGSWRVPAEQTRGSGGEKSDTNPEWDHILVCQTLAFLPNPCTVTNNPSMSLNLPLCLFVSLADSFSPSVFLLLYLSCFLFVYTDLALSISLLVWLLI